MLTFPICLYLAPICRLYKVSLNLFICKSLHFYTVTFLTPKFPSTITNLNVLFISSKYIGFTQWYEYEDSKESNVNMISASEATELDDQKEVDTISWDPILPSSLIHLKLGGDFDFMPTLPLSITHLTFGVNFSQPLYGLPSSLQYLHHLQPTPR